MHPEDDLTTIHMEPPVPPVPLGLEPALGSENYFLGREIARGGMGSILEGQDRKLNRTVAVKVALFESDMDTSMRARFLREAEVLAQLSHPNIVPIHDIVWEDGVPLFYTMKLVKGRTLQAILIDLRNGQPEALAEFSLDRLLWIFRKICDAIAFAHSRGIIHRDLKPENIMVGEFGEVLVMDWGLAKKIRHSEGKTNRQGDDRVASVGSAGEAFSLSDGLKVSPSQKTLQGSVMGTPQYMSPEQAAGETDTLDERSDIFSLGAILYAILTLRPPVEGETVEELLEKVRSAQITPPTAFGAATGRTVKHGKSGVLEAKKITPLPHMPSGRVPSSLSAVTMHALRLDKATRYQKVPTLIAEIERYQGGFATAAEDAGTLKQLRLLMLRHKAVTSLLGVMLLLSIGFVIELVASEKRAVNEASRATRAEADAVEKAETIRQALAKSSMSLAEAALRESDGVAMQVSLNAVPADLRDSTWHYLRDQSDNTIAHIGDSQIFGVAADPTRPGVFAVAGEDNIIRLIELRTDRELLQFSGPNRGAKKTGRLSLAFSPDGSQIAAGLQTTGKAARISIHNADDGTILREWKALNSRRLNFSRDGQSLIQHVRGGIHYWQVGSGALRWEYQEMSWPDNVGGAFTPDGQRVITHDHVQGLRLVEAQTGALVRKMGGEGLPFSTIAIDPNGTRFFAGLDSGKIQCRDMMDGRILFQFQSGEKKVDHLLFTPEGTHLISATRLANGSHAMQVWDASTGALLRTLRGAEGLAYAAALHPKSGELVVSGDPGRAWVPIGLPPTWTIPAKSKNRLVAFWDSDDQLFAPYGESGGCLLSLTDKTPAALWQPQAGVRTLVSVSAEGRFAALAAGGIGGTAPIQLLQKPSSSVEQIATFTPARFAQKLSLSPTGDCLAVIEGRATAFNDARARTGVELFRTTSGSEGIVLEIAEMKLCWDIGWLDDGSQIVGLVTANDTTDSRDWLYLWDAATAKIVAKVPYPTAMRVLAVAPDGSRFAEAGIDKIVRIRDAKTLAVQHAFRAHNKPITAMAWHPSKPVLVTGSAALSIKLWNLETGDLMEEFSGPVTSPSSLAFSPSGRRLACAAPDEPTRIWEPPSLQK